MRERERVRGREGEKNSGNNYVGEAHFLNPIWSQRDTCFRKLEKLLPLFFFKGCQFEPKKGGYKSVEQALAQIRLKTTRQNIFVKVTEPNFNEFLCISSTRKV